MVKGSLVVLALTATVAHAQENSEIGRNPGATVSPGEGEVVAARSLVPRPDAGAGTPDGGVDGVGAVKEPTMAPAGLADCSVLESLLNDRAPAVRHYAAPPAPPSDDRRNEWDRAPYVGAVVRCGQRYFLQVHSQSTARMRDVLSADSWIIDQARVEGPQGETLQVAKPEFRQQAFRWGINVIVAEAPPGTKLSMLKVHMVGKDGWVAQTTVEELP